MNAIPTATRQRDVLPLVRTVSRNRFLPLPPASLLTGSEPEFREFGAEFLGHFVAQGKLAPHERVLDIGCGPGRMAVPLTQYLDDTGSYDGVDIVAPGIAWCRATITPVYPRFRFHHLDLAHPLYNPGGSLATTATRLPFAAASFDFVGMVSLLPHLTVAEVAHYAGEAARLLAPRGRCLVTGFLMNPEAREAMRAGGGTLPFDADAAGPVWHAYSEVPSAAVAFDEAALVVLFERAGLRRRPGVAYGGWSGRAALVFQDICVFERG